MNTPDAPDPRKVAEAALEAFVYVPLGLALEAKDLVPKLAQRGRNQVVLARLGARFAAQRFEAEAERLAQRLQPTTRASGTTPTEAATTSTEAAMRGDAAVHSDATDVADAVPSEPVEKLAVEDLAEDVTAPVAPRPTARPTRRKTVTRPDTGPSVASLAITGYDTLSASQVIPRLEALRPDELEAVRVHEAAHRGRRTILSRIAQLQG